MYFISFQRFVVGAKLQELRITVKRRDDPILSHAYSTYLE